MPDVLKNNNIYMVLRHLNSLNNVNLNVYVFVSNINARPAVCGWGDVIPIAYMLFVWSSLLV